MDNQKPTIWDWLHINRNPDFFSAKYLGGAIALVLLIICIMFVIIFFTYLIYLLLAAFGIGPYGGDGTGAAVRNIVLLLAAIVGFPFIAWRSIVAQKQVNVSEQGQITDRINMAISGLGSEKTVKEVEEIQRYKQDDDGNWLYDDVGEPVPAIRPDGTLLIDRKVYERTVPNLEVRIGAIYALERIAKDSLRDHLQIMEMLCAYIRENAPAQSLEPNKNLTERPVPSVDIQAAISVIGRRSDSQIDLEWQNEFRLDLRNSDLSGIDFGRGNFSAAMFHSCRMEAAYLEYCRLEGTQFYRALLNYSDFYKAELRGTRFDHAVNNLPEVTSSFSWHRSIQIGNIYGISFVGADMSAIDDLGQTEETNLTIGSIDTKLCKDLEFDRTEFKKLHLKIRKLRREGNFNEAEELEKDMLKNNRFAAWVPYNSNDLALPHRYSEFLDRLGLFGWPYR